MIGTKFCGYASAARSVAFGANGMVVFAAAVLVVVPALPGLTGSPRRMSAQPRIAVVHGVNPCEIAAYRYRNDLNYEPPPGCWDTWFFQGSDGHWRVPLPSDSHSVRPPPGAPSLQSDAPPPPPAGENQ